MIKTFEWTAFPILQITFMRNLVLQLFRCLWHRTATWLAHSQTISGCFVKLLSCDAVSNNLRRVATWNKKQVVFSSRSLAVEMGHLPAAWPRTDMSICRLVAIWKKQVILCRNVFTNFCSGNHLSRTHFF